MQPKLRLKLAAANIPHPDKASYGGEDAYFVSDAGGGAAGVADGVGGWQESGINPAEYSATFMDFAKRYLEGEELPDPPTRSPAALAADAVVGTASGEWMDSPPSEDPVSVLSTSSSIDSPGERTALGALAAAHARTRKPGSATACVLRVDPLTGELDAANLGDSGFLIIRNGKLIFQSPHLQHFFDCPFQFGAAPEFTPATDTAEDAAVYRLALQPGDVIVLATDGALDNVWPEDIVALAPRSAGEVQAAADALASLAACHGADPEYDSPYAMEAREEGIDIPIWEKIGKVSFSNGQVQLGQLSGGKQDDVTVVMAWVEASSGGGAVADQPASAAAEESKDS